MLSFSKIVQSNDALSIEDSEMTEGQAVPTAAEFFAGVGLVRMALERVGVQVAFANDISPVKQRMYAENFDGGEFELADIRDLTGNAVPTVDIATASFPCTDVSLAGGRAGLKGRESGLLGDFLRILDEMGDRRPQLLLIENVTGFATSDKGRDLVRTLEYLTELGYWCDVQQLDARNFVPQSRPRMFILCDRAPTSIEFDPLEGNVSIRPNWAAQLFQEQPGIRSYHVPIPLPSKGARESLEDILEPFGRDDPVWWEDERKEKFEESLSAINTGRAKVLRENPAVAHATSYRRTRGGRAVWEIRGDNISGCLRTTRGGSSKQAVVEGGEGELRVRWMTAREYARLQGAPDFKWGDASDLQAKFALGDAVCVPAVEWLARHHFARLLNQDNQQVVLSIPVAANMATVSVS